MKAVILAPHQDDEMLGAACAIFDWLEQGFDIHIAWVTHGSQAYIWGRKEGWLIEEPGKTDVSESELIEIRKTEAKNAMKIVGVPEENLYFFDLPDQGGDANIDPGVELLKPLLDGADILVMPANGEIHIDHAAAFQIGVRACQELGLNDIDIYLYKLVGVYGGFKDVKDRKVKWKMADKREKFMEAMQCYDSQKNLNLVWVGYEVVANSGSQFLVKVKLDEYGQFDYF